MIRVKRPAGSTPQVLRKHGKGYQELSKNNLLHAAGKHEDMKFEAYKDKSVREALNSLFGRKCVFCESLLLGTQAGDIEHFRPKGRVVVIDPLTNEKKEKPGYHWLAARWRNLLISCQDCNRPRTQRDAFGKSKVMGKASYFPLADENLRATSPTGVRKEAALLLHPCVDKPELHLMFTDEGGIRPKDDGTGPSKKGSATIDYCGLARAELLQMRARHRRTVMAAISHVINAFEQEKDPGQDLDDLLFMLDPKEAYTAFTRHLVGKHLGPYLCALGITL